MTDALRKEREQLLNRLAEIQAELNRAEGEALAGKIKAKQEATIDEPFRRWRQTPLANLIGSLVRCGECKENTKLCENHLVGVYRGIRFDYAYILCQACKQVVVISERLPGSEWKLDGIRTNTDQ